MKFINAVIITIGFLFFFNTVAQAQLATNKQAPDFVLPDINGNDFQLSKKTGEKLILINFWATWCAPCLDEMKAMIPIYEKYKDQGFEVVSISVDDNKTAGRVPSFVNTRKYPFIILQDINNEVMKLYQTTVPPYTAIIDTEGKIIYSHTGYRKGDEVKLDDFIRLYFMNKTHEAK